MAYILCASTEELIASHPWEGISIDRAYFYDLLIQTALLGHRLVLVAEDVFRHPVLRQELVETSKSLARLFLNEGHIKILGQLTEPPALYHIHAKKISSLLSCVQASQAELIRPANEIIEQEFLHLLNQLPRQNCNEQGFYLNDIPEREFNLIINGFFKRVDNGARPSRDLVLQLLNTLYGQTQGPWQSEGKRKLMQLLADVSSCALGRALQKTLGQVVGIEGQFSPLIGTASAAQPMQMAPLDGPVSLIKLPWPNSLLQPKTWQKALGNNEFSAAQTVFIKTAQAFMHQPITRQHVDELIHSTEEFQVLLHWFFAKSSDKDMLANPANLILSFEPTSFAGSPVIGELYWQQAFNGFRRIMALWNFNGRLTGAVDNRTLPSYQLVYTKKKLSAVALN
ncbi:MAG: hypothetical protein RL497_1772 [Pseudomonadota bacterium]|jgi:hypothetical protein